jgi:hypothetical protein
VCVHGSRDGFALLLVVAVLFAVGMAGAAGYQVVRVDADRALQVQESGRALTVARQGLERFLAEQGAGVADAAEYSLDGGIARIQARKLLEGAGHPVYDVSSTGLFFDPRTPGAPPAVRVVRQQAELRPIPFVPLAALITTGDLTYDNRGPVQGGGGGPFASTKMYVSGYDAAYPAVCSASGAEGVPAALLAGAVTVLGEPDPETFKGIGVREVPGVTDPAAAVGVPWSQLVDPSFPVDHTTLPPSGSIAAGDYPVVRIEGDLKVNSSYRGRGALIVTGTFEPGGGMEWEGIILAGQLPIVLDRSFEVRGVLVAGLNGSQPELELRSGGRVIYDSCHALAAASRIRRVVSRSNTWWEAG